MKREDAPETGLPRAGLSLYLVAAKAMAGVHDEGLSSIVILSHIQAMIRAEVLKLQNVEQRGEPGEHS